MANIKVAVEKPIADGYKLKFRTPCGSNAIEGLDVKYPAKNGVGTLIKKFVFKDAHGTDLSGVGNLFVGGVMIEVLLDVTHGVAYIKNADTNSYVEKEIDAIRKSHIQFWDVASKAVDDAKERAESVQGIYVGGGDMPDGYSVQIDPDGDAIVVDTALDDTSNNPVANRVLKNVIDTVHNSAVARDEEISRTVSPMVEAVPGLIESVNLLTEQDLPTQISDNRDAINELKNKAHKSLYFNEIDEKVSAFNGGKVVDGISDYRLFAFNLQDVTVGNEDKCVGSLLLYAVQGINADNRNWTACASAITSDGVTYNLSVKFDMVDNKVTVTSFGANGGGATVGDTVDPANIAIVEIIGIM